MELKHKLAAFAVAVIALSACTPEEMQMFNSATGHTTTAASGVTASCNETFSGVAGTVRNECLQPAVRLDLNRLIQEQASTYRWFPSCKEAVEVLFAGRWDLSRALHVVYRESNYVPTVVSRTGARGCAQLTSGIRNAFLEGPWRDPYWNVLAMRKAVDDPDWGWCHWDIVNYCRAGGEF